MTLKVTAGATTAKEFDFVGCSEPANLGSQLTTQASNRRILTRIELFEIAPRPNTEPVTVRTAKQPTALVHDRGR